MFQQLKNIDTAFKHVRAFSMLLVVVCGVISLYAMYSAQQTIRRAEDKIFVLANGKVLEAIGMDRKDNIPVEARDHISTFHEYFFTLDPDDKVIQTNLTKALYLADRSARDQYNSLKENAFYANIISGNISQDINIDSITLNMDQYPIPFRCRATVKIVRPSSIVTRSLLTEGYLRNMNRSDNNPHGFLIERWKTIENKDLKTESR
jgi:conjugative transposon TraK protein